jgi:hypothetical protein
MLFSDRGKFIQNEPLELGQEKFLLFTHSFHKYCHRTWLMAFIFGDLDFEADPGIPWA